MDYGFGKTYTLPEKMHALTGAIQYYVLKTKTPLVVEDDATLAEKATAQANYLRVLEVLRTYGGQPVIAAVGYDDKGEKNANCLKFTLEQSNVFGLGGLKEEIEGHQQVSYKADYGFEKAAQEKIEAMFANVKAIKIESEGEGDDEVILGEVANDELLFDSVTVEPAF